MAPLCRAGRLPLLTVLLLLLLISLFVKNLSPLLVYDRQTLLNMAVVDRQRLCHRSWRLCPTTCSVHLFPCPASVIESGENGAIKLSDLKPTWRSLQSMILVDPCGSLWSMTASSCGDPRMSTGFNQLFPAPVATMDAAAARSVSAFADEAPCWKIFDLLLLVPNKASAKRCA